MTSIKKSEILFENISSLKGVGKKLSKYFKNKKIEKINDILWDLPYAYTDRSNLVTLNKLEIGKILTMKIKVIKYNFPRIRNLPNRIACEDSTGKIDLVYFNSREGYLKKILPLNSEVVVSGKINYFRNKYQITNPDYVTDIQKINYVKTVIPKYSLTEGLTEKLYRKIIDQVLNNLPSPDEWYSAEVLKKFNFTSWTKSIYEIHKSSKNRDINSLYYRRLALDEILSHLIILSNNRRKIKKIKKTSKKFTQKISFSIIKNLKFTLTNNQKEIINEINIDLRSNSKMFRILQGDVGSGKTIIAIITAANVIENKAQCAFMAPTDILAKQHFELCKKIFINTNIKIEYLSGKTDNKKRKEIIEKLKKKEIDFLIGTHSLFQKKIEFNKLGYIIIDEQHKFGVKQRMELSKKGGDNCDVLLMSATPIPRTMMLSIYGDMDISRLTEKPRNRKKIITLSKPENKLNEIIKFVERQLKEKNQIFWVCPLIEDSKFLDYTSATSRFKQIKEKFGKKVALLHGSIDKEEKNIILNKFLKREIDILISTTVIEVGIDFPNANLIIIENANKFGLAQLHQLRGRVGRGKKQGICILVFKGNLNKNAIKRIKILKSTNDGFLISEEDMNLRGFGDIVGYQQSGIKYFKIADPVAHGDLFKFAEKYIKEIENKKYNPDKYNFLLKLFDKAEIINLET